MTNGIDVISSGTDTHLVLLNLKELGLTGQQAKDTLAEISLTSNKNPIPFDSAKPSEWVGLIGGCGSNYPGTQQCGYGIIGFHDLRLFTG